MIGACINQVAYDRPDNNRRVGKSIFTGSMGRAMIQMASVFGEQERQIIRSRVVAASIVSVSKAKSSVAR
jgi:hypothetical protein